MLFLFLPGLLALVSLPIILALHLIRERRRRVLVPSVLLWQHLPQRPDTQRRRLPLTLLLLLHLLAAAALALALAQPQWLGGLLGGEQRLAVIIDTSLSMAARDRSGIRLQQARDRANALINGLRGDDAITLISAGPQAQLLMTGGIAHASGLQTALDNLAPEGVGTDLDGALTLANAALEANDQGRIVVISDAALPDLESTLADHARPIDWEQVGANLDNRAIVAFAAQPWSGGQSRVYARVANYSQTAVGARLRLIGDDALIEERRLSIRPEGDIGLTWELPPGIETLRLELADADALADDNSASLNLSPARTINTLLVSNTPGALEKALRATPGLNVQMITPEAYAIASPAAYIDLTIFDNTLPSAWPAGGVLVIHPPVNNGPLLPVRETTPDRKPAFDIRPAADTQLFDGLNIDSLPSNTARDLDAPDWATIQLADGETPLILRGHSGQSEIAVWTFDANAEPLATRLIFPLLVTRTVRDLTPAPLPASVAAGETLTLRPSPHADALDIRGPDGNMRTISYPERTEEPPDEAGATTIDLALTQPGNYVLSERQGDKTLFTGQLAVNAGSPLESDLRPRPIPASQPNPPAPTAADEADPGTENDARPAWPWLAGLALLVMLFEWWHLHTRRRPIGANG